jgi:transmembrane sensor
MAPDSDITRIANYVAGEGSRDQRAETERWIAADPARAEMVDAIRDAWVRAGSGEPQLDVDRAWEKVQRRQAARDMSESAAPRAPAAAVARHRVLELMPRSSRRVVWARAAAVILVVGAGAVLTRLMTWSPEAKVPAAAMREVATARGQRATVTLSDGSRVSLGVASKLRFAEGFGGSRRDVYLEGEALFRVRHDSLRPFAVHTPRATTTDLGTTFVVRDYAVDRALLVGVREGSVAIGGDTLKAGDAARVDAKGRVARARVDDVFAWTEGRLAFRNTSLAEAAAALERWYDVEIGVAPAVRERTVNATFSDDGIETVLHLIAKATDVRVEHRGKTFTLRAIGTGK